MKKLNFYQFIIYILLAASGYANEDNPNQDIIENDSEVSYESSNNYDNTNNDDADIIAPLDTTVSSYANEDNPNQDIIENDSEVSHESSNNYDNTNNDDADIIAPLDTTESNYTYSIKQAIDDVYGNIFMNSRTEEELIHYLNTLVPDESGMAVGISNYVIKQHQNSIYNRISGTRNNYNIIKCQSLDFYKNNKFDTWSMISTGKSYKKSINKTTGYSNKTNHFIIGVDSYISNYIFGFSLGLDYSSGSTFTPENTQRDQDMLQNSFLTSIYTSGYIVNKLFCCAIVSLGYSKVKASRLRDAAKMNSNYTTKFNKYNISASYEFNFLAVNIEPEIITRFATVNVDAYKNIPENSNIDPIEGEFHDSIRDYIFDIGVGVSLTQTWLFSESFLTLKLKSVLYKNMNKTKTVPIRIKWLFDDKGMLKDYNSHVINKQANTLDTELGIDFAFKKMHFSIYYTFSKDIYYEDISFKSKYYQDNTLSVKVNIPF